jgi:hypothetical protein
MQDFNPFDVDFDADNDGIDLLGFDCMVRYLSSRDQDEGHIEVHDAGDDETSDGLWTRGVG